MTNERAWQAIVDMRLCLETAERIRREIVARKIEVKTSTKATYKRTKRETFGALEQITTRLADDDQTARIMIGDEQFYRGLTVMYAEVARAELALEEAIAREQANPSLRDARASRAQRIMD